MTHLLSDLLTPTAGFNFTFKVYFYFIILFYFILFIISVFVTAG